MRNKVDICNNQSKVHHLRMLRVCRCYQVAEGVVHVWYVTSRCINVLCARGLLCAWIKLQTYDVCTRVVLEYVPETVVQQHETRASRRFSRLWPPAPRYGFTQALHVVPGRSGGRTVHRASRWLVRGSGNAVHSTVHLQMYCT